MELSENNFVHILNGTDRGTKVINNSSVTKRCMLVSGSVSYTSCKWNFNKAKSIAAAMAGN